MSSADIFEALDAFDSSIAKPNLSGVFPHLRLPRRTYALAVDVGWNPLVLRLLACLDAAAESMDRTIGVEQVREKFDLLRVDLDLSGIDVVLRDRCDTLVAEAEAESARRCQRCGDRGELARDRPYIAVLCQRHHRTRGMVKPDGSLPVLSAHARLRLAKHIGAAAWSPILTPSSDVLLRARIVDDGVAFAVSLRADAGTEAAPHVVAAALANGDGSMLDLSGDALMEREVDLASRIADQV